jgi:hypothetical protein
MTTMRSATTIILTLAPALFAVGCAIDPSEGRYAAPFLEEIAIPFFATLLLGIANVAIAVVAVQAKRRFGVSIDESQLAIARGLARDAIARAEQWSIQEAARRGEGTPPSGDEKLGKALEYWRHEATRLRLPQRAAEEVTEFIEAQLGRWELYDENARIDGGI